MKAPKKTIDVREELDLWLPQGPQACFDMMRRDVLSTPLDIAALSSADPFGNFVDPRRVEVAKQMDRVRAYFENLGWEEAKPQVEAMTRYFFEGINRVRALLSGQEQKGESYEEDSAMYDRLGATDFVKGPKGGTVVDLGCGPGRGLESFPSQAALGVDLSPSFAVANPRVVCGTIDAPFEEFLSQVEPYLPSLERPRLVVSSLTLDRVRDPRAFLETMNRLGDEVTVATLLPIVPVDDGPNVKNRITYTPPKLRLTPGATEEEDRRILEEYLADTFGSQVEARRVPYVCNSSDGVQVYDNYWAFSFAGQRQ